MHKSAEEQGYNLFKIPDPSRAMFRKNGGARYVQKLPYDAIFTGPGRVFAVIEAKVVKPGGRLELRPHQYTNLMREYEWGNGAWILVRKEERKPPATVWAVPIHWFKRALVEGNGKYVQYAKVEVIGLPLRKIKGGWDVTRLTAMPGGYYGGGMDSTQN